MATRVFTFHIAYSGLDERIWRDVEVSSKMRLDQLGYVVLATFDTMAYHLFEIIFRGRAYAIPDVDYAQFWEEKRLAAIHKAAVPKPRAKERAPLSERDICRNFFEAVLSQKPDKLRKLFQKNAVIEWPCTNERFTLEEYVRANCEYPGEWDGEIVSVIPAEKQTVLITKVWPKDKTASFHCVSIIRAKKDKITGLTEYWADDGPVPQWRQELEGR